MILFELVLVKHKNGKVWKCQSHLRAIITTKSERSLQTVQGLYCLVEFGQVTLPLIREYKTMVKMVFFAQIFVKQWSSGTKTSEFWLEMISIYLTLVWFEVLYKDPDSRNNVNFSGESSLSMFQTLSLS